MLGDKIKALRKENEWSQMDLAARLHIDQSSLSRYERNVCTPNVDVMMILAELLAVEPTQLFLEWEADRNDRSTEN
jgi:transcriptional regulator with XRE-family HTH domain